MQKKLISATSEMQNAPSEEQDDLLIGIWTTVPQYNMYSSVSSQSLNQMPEYTVNFMGEFNQVPTELRTISK